MVDARDPKAVLLLVLGALLACKKANPDEAALSATASAAAAPAASVPPPPRAKIESHEIPDGVVDGLWLPKFRITQAAADAGGLTFDAARAACSSQRLALCTAPQLRAACASDPAIGATESWSSGATDAGIAVRGGGGCSSERAAPGSAPAVTRLGLCCEPAIAIDTTNKNRSFLLTTEQKLLAVERALNSGSGASFAAVLADEVRFYGAKKTREQARGQAESWFGQYPAQWTAHQSCAVTLQLHPGASDSDTWTALCEQTLSRGTELAVVKKTYVFGGKEMKVIEVSEGALTRKYAAP